MTYKVEKIAALLSNIGCATKEQENDFQKRP